MKPVNGVHTTNYTNTFISVAEDSPVQEAQVPLLKGDKKSVANLQFEMIEAAPYQHTSDDVLFTVHAERAGIPAKERKEERAKFFSKGQPCFRASPLGKRYGWGLHADAAGKIAVYPVESKEYKAFAADNSLQQVKAMRSTRG